MDFLNSRVAQAALLCLLAVGVAPTGAVAASHPFDGSWTLVFVTRAGACDPSYNFAVNVSQGIITHPNLVRFRGRVARNGAARASVHVGEKSAVGTGRLSGASGSGSWVGYAGASRCSGSWTAQKY